MQAPDASQLLRAGLLEGVSLLLACAPGDVDRAGSFAVAVRDTAAELGAAVARCPVPEPDGEGGDEPLQAAVGEALAGLGELDGLVCDAGGLFAQARSGQAGAGALRGCLERSWAVTQQVVSCAFLVSERPGRVIYLAPAPDAGPHADAARAGLENLARTLSIEWARHAINAVTIAPGNETTAGELAALTAYLASQAGAYFSGCLLDLRGPRPAAARRAP